MWIVAFGLYRRQHFVVTLKVSPKGEVTVMRVVNRFSAATAAVVLAAALAVPGCGSYDTERAAETESAEVSDPTPEPPATPEPDEPVDMEWTRWLNDVAVTPDGVVYASAYVGIAALDELGEWTIVDLDGLPEGKGADEFLPGRLINNVATGPDGQLWATGWAYSTLDDEAFGGTIGGWTEARDLSWIARHDCLVDGCSWEVFTSDDTPGLLTTFGESEWPADFGDVAIGADGTVYASMGEHQLVVYDGSGWAAHTVPDLPTAWNGSVSPWSSSLAVGADGLLWAGTNAGDAGQGLFTFDGAEFTHLTTADGLPDDNVFRVAAGSDGTIWVATDVLYANPATASPDEAAGVASFDGTSWTTHTLADGLLSNDGMVAAGPDGTVWVVHNEVGQRGYARFDGAGWTAYPTDPPVGGFRAAVDTEGTLWSAAEDGLVRFDGTTKTVYESPFLADLPTSTTEEVSSETLEDKLPAAGIVCDHDGPVGAGDVIACEHPDGRGVLISIVDDDGTWVGAASDRFPATAVGLDAWHSDLGLGHNCTDLLAQDLLRGADERSRYVAALAYFYLDGQSYLMDIDENGIPCETLFPAELVDEVFAGGWFDGEYPVVPAAATVTADQLAAELGEEVTFEGRGWACTAETTGPIGYGSVFTCRPDPQPVEGQWPVVTLLMISDTTWAAAESGLAFPLLHPTGRDVMITGPMPRGVNCTDLLAEGSSFSQLTEGLTPAQTYFAVVLHYFLDGQPTPLMDIDSNGIPCETLFAPEVVAQVWDGGYLQVPGAPR